MLHRTVRQIIVVPKFILHQNAKVSTRQYFCLYGIQIRLHLLSKNPSVHLSSYSTLYVNQSYILFWINVYMRCVD